MYVRIHGDQKQQIMKLYIASKLYLAQIQKFFKNDTVLEICSIWTEFIGTPTSMEIIWQSCLRGLNEADALLIISKSDDVLKGGLLELGYALGRGIPCVHLSISGKSPYTFIGDNLPVKEVFTIEDALNYLKIDGNFPLDEINKYISTIVEIENLLDPNAHQPLIQ